MDWSPQQLGALDSITRWAKGDDQVFYLAGYAGTGKTELAKHMAEAVGGKILFGAYTGKAAYVLRQRGCAGASTIHKMIYQPKDKSRQKLLELQGDLMDILLVDPVDIRKQHDLEREIAEEKENLKRPFFSLNPDSEVITADLVVIDEVSMVDQYVGEDLLSFGTKVLVIGDPFQLQPVRGTGYFTKNTPDVMLTEIHRQARDNPIIKLATTIRDGKTLEIGQYGESRVIDWADVEPEDAQEADQILVGTNKLRRATNFRMRDLLGMDVQGALPMKGDRLVCLRNDHKVGLLNGAIWFVNHTASVDDEFMALEVVSEDGGAPLEVTAHIAPFLGQDIPNPWDRRKAQEFDYGYALTVHKSQGSQWKTVLVFDQSKTFKKQAHNWLYTAVTRAAEKVTIVR